MSKDWDPSQPMKGPRIVSYTLGSKTYEWLIRAIDLGLFEGGLGEMKLAASVQKVMDALHTVLAGGEVKIDTVHRGNPDIIHEMERRMDEAAEEANEINKRAGYYVTAAG